jgi:hypothetical protein
MDHAEPAIASRSRLEVGIEPDVRGLLARLHHRFPDVGPGLLEACVEDALARSREAVVRTYLTILVERWAEDSAVRLSRSANRLTADDRPIVAHAQGSDR